MSIYRIVLALTMIGVSNAALGCDVTLSSGANLHSAVSSYSGKHICLGAGTYNLGATPLAVPSGTKIEGIGASRDSVVLNSTSQQRGIITSNNVMLKNFLLNGPGTYGFGVLAYDDSDVIIWSLRVQNFQINIGVSLSERIDIWDTFMRYNGDLTDGGASPNLWINSSDDVVVLYGEATGRANGPGGDGEVAAHNSTNVIIEGTHVIDSGASAIYYVNCDNCKIVDTFVDRADEWGVDIVQGSDSVEVRNNYIAWSSFGGAVFDEAGSVGGAFTQNVLIKNRQLGVGACNGINVIGNVSGVLNSGNSSSPSGVICKYQ